MTLYMVLQYQQTMHALTTNLVCLWVYHGTVAVKLVAGTPHL